MASVVASFLVAAVPGVSLEGAQGLETVAFAALVTAALGRGQHWAWWAGVAAWVRPEGVLVSGVLWLLRRGRRDLLILASFIGGITAFRLAYYGDIVPNTFHAKVGDGPRWDTGIEYLELFALEYGLVLWVPLLVAAVLFHRRRASGALPLLFAAVTLPHVVYVAAIGGDLGAFPN